MMDLSLIAICCSIHLQGININPNSYQQINPGIGVEYEAKGFGAATTLFYRDSYGRAATCAAYSPYRGWLRPFVGTCNGYGDRRSEYDHFAGRIEYKTVTDERSGFGKFSPAAGVNIEPWHRTGPTLIIAPIDTTGIVIGLAWKEGI